MDSKHPAKLSPITIKNTRFHGALWGYSRREVLDFLDATAKFVEKLQGQERELLEQVQNLSMELAKWKAREGEIEALIENARAEAENARAAARIDAAKLLEEVEQKANEIRGKTEKWLETLLSEIEETERRRNSFVTAFRSALDSHYELLKSEESAFQPLGERLTSFLKSKTEAEPSPLI